MSDIDAAVWNFLPARPDSRRTTVAPVIAVNIGSPVRDVQEALLRMERTANVVADRHGRWYRGLPLNTATRARERNEDMFEDAVEGRLL